MGRGSSKASGGTVMKFSDTPYMTREYGGDGKEAEDFFSTYTNSYQLIPQIEKDSDAHDAFFMWAEGYFMHGEQYEGYGNMSDREKQFTKKYDEYLDQTVTGKSFEVVRLSTAEMLMGAGNKRASLAELKKAEGGTVYCRANLSTAAAAQGLVIDTFSKKNVEYHITIPKGSKGAGMYIGDKRICGWGNKQREFLMNRDSLYKVGKVGYDKSRKVYTVDLTFMGHDKHDYGN